MLNDIDTWPRFTPVREVFIIEHLIKHGFHADDFEKNKEQHAKSADKYGFLADVLRTMRAEMTPEAVSTEKKDSHDKRESEHILFGYNWHQDQAECSAERKLQKAQAELRQTGLPQPDFDESKSMEIDQDVKDDADFSYRGQEGEDNNIGEEADLVLDDP